MSARAIVTVIVVDGDTVLHEETRSAWNAALRASEAAVRAIARAEGTTYAGDRPEYDPEHTRYVRTWQGPSRALTATVTRP